MPKISTLSAFMMVPRMSFKVVFSPNSKMSIQTTFIYIAHLKTTGVVSKCFSVKVNQFTITINKNNRIE